MGQSKSKIRYIKNPSRIIRALGKRGFFNWLSDKPYLNLIYWGETGKKLNINEPVTYNEKLQWLKLYDRKPEYCYYVDKYAVRSYIAETIGEQYLIPLYDLYDNVEAIEWGKLPNEFVLKCTHGSSSNIICTDKDRSDINDSKIKLNKWMKKNWYWFGREWPYKNVRPRIICEKYMVDESGTELKDYKIFCFNGVPRLIQVDFDRFTRHKRNIYDTEWNYVPVEIKYPTDKEKIIPKPEKLELMLTFAKKLSKDYPHVRVDFYCINDTIYFGELTFYHGSGFEKMMPEEFNIKMGEWIKLPKEQTTQSK